MKRLLVRSGFIACGAVLFGMLFHALSTHRSSVTGAREQNGWTFVRQFSGEPCPARTTNAFLTFLRQAFGQDEEQSLYWPPYPALMLIAPEGEGNPGGDMQRAGVTVQALSSTGDRFSLGGEDPDGTNNDGRDVYVRLPAVPAAYQWLDVTVTDKQSRQATWRVADLPRLAHQTLGPLQAEPITPVPGVTLTARAYWSPQDAPVSPNGWCGPRNDVIPVNAEIRLQKKQNGDRTHYWMLANFTLREEWEWQPATGQTSGTLGDSFRPEVGSRPNAIENYRLVGFAAPHPRQQRTVQISGGLEEHQTASETITFHDLHFSRMGAGWSLDPNANAIVRSPSGITVRVVPTAARAADAGPLSTYQITKDRIYYRFEIDQYGRNETLPASPLYQRYHHPIDVAGAFVYINDFPTWETYCDSSVEAGRVEGGFNLNSIPANHVLPTLKFTVTQDTVLRTAPVRFVVPVTEGKPKMEWNP